MWPLGKFRWAESGSPVVIELRYVSGKIGCTGNPCGYQGILKDHFSIVFLYLDFNFHMRFKSKIWKNNKNEFLEYLGGYNPEVP